MTEADLRLRTKRFALRIMRLVDSLPRTISGRTVASQLCRSGTSVAANYRAACRGRSRKEFIAKLGIAEEEADESAFWMELIMDAKLQKPTRVAPLHDEANQLLSILIASRLTATRSGTIENQKSKIKNP